MMLLKSSPVRVMMYEKYLQPLNDYWEIKQGSNNPQ